MVLDFLYWEAKGGKLPLIAFKTLSLKKETVSSELPVIVNDRKVSLCASVVSLLQSDTDVIVSVALDSMSCTKWFLGLWSLMWFYWVILFNCRVHLALVDLKQIKLGSKISICYFTRSLFCSFILHSFTCSFFSWPKACAVCLRMVDTSLKEKKVYCKIFCLLFSSFYLKFLT